MALRDKVIEEAEKWVGYLEKASNSQLESKTANAGYNNYIIELSQGLSLDRVYAVLLVLQLHLHIENLSIISVEIFVMYLSILSLVGI